MNKSIISIAIIFFAIFTVACKKESIKPVTPAPSVNGYWEGQITPSGSSSPQYLSLLYNNDGTIRGYVGNPDTTIASKASGTYSIDADSIRATFPSGSNASIFSAKLSGSGAMNGTVRKTTSTYSATYTITKL